MLKIDPEILLETLGIDNYRIDYDKLKVYLTPEEYSKLAKYSGKSLRSSELEYGGWRWCKDAETADTR